MLLDTQDPREFSTSISIYTMLGKGVYRVSNSYQMLEETRMNKIK